MTHQTRVLQGVLTAGLAISACSESTTSPARTESGSISLSLSQSSVTVRQGEAQAMAVATIIRAGSFTGPVTITVTGHPIGSSVAVSEVETTGATTSATLTITVGADVTPAVYPLEVHGTGSGVGAVTRELVLTVAAILGPEEIGQWATAATASSQYTDIAWAAHQATGAPNSAGCEDDGLAWASLEGNTAEWLEVSYLTPVQPTMIRIYETYSPGSIVKVEVKDDAGQYTTVYTAPVSAPACPHTLEILVMGVTTKISAVRISVDQRTHQDWNEIDAVQLVGRP